MDILYTILAQTSCSQQSLLQLQTLLAITLIIGCALDYWFLKKRVKHLERTVSHLQNVLNKKDE